MRTIIDSIVSFRQDFYNLIHYRADATLDLIDALSSNQTADSVVKLSLNSLFRRGYSSITDVIDNFFFESSEKANKSTLEVTKQTSTTNPSTEDKNNSKETKAEKTILSEQTSGKSDAISKDSETLPRLNELSRLITQHCLFPSKKEYYTFAVDAVPQSRPFARTLEDRSVVHFSNPAPGNKPITIGHQYSTLVYLPEKKMPNDPPWVAPISVKRVTSKDNAEVVGMQQALQITKEISRHSPNSLSLIVADSKYSSLKSRQVVVQESNMISVSRLAKRRNIYEQPKNKNDNKSAGRPPWYGVKMKLHDEKTHVKPDETTIINLPTCKGKTHKVTLEMWKDRLVRGSKKFKSHKHPFNLIRATVRDQDGNLVFERPLWLMVQGKKRHELNSEIYYKEWCKRYDIEHFFRFGKQHLLMDKSQTSKVQHEENWWQLTQVAYVQLYLARELSQKIPYDWERYLPESEYKYPERTPSPSQVQRDFNRLHEIIGTPAKESIVRGVSSGRKKGDCPPARPKQAVIFKGKKTPKITKTKASEGKKIITPTCEQTQITPTSASYSSLINQIKKSLKDWEMSPDQLFSQLKNDLAV